MSTNRDKVVAFREFKAKLQSLGFFECQTDRVLSEMFFFVLLTLIGITTIIYMNSLLFDVVGMALTTIGSMGVSTNTHMWSHAAASRKHWLSKSMTYFGYPFFLQLSATYWRNKHLVVHHPQPNVVGVDDDATLAPFFALTREEVDQATGIKKWVIRIQGLLFPIAVVFNSFGVVLTGWWYLIRQLVDSETRNKEHWIDLGVLALHYLIWMVIPCFFFPIGDVIVFTLVRYALISYGLFALFAPAHYPAEAVMVEPRAIQGDWVYMQVATTVNFSTGRFGRLLCAGVDYQIEHHLFPTICHTRLKELSPYVQEYCEQQGYPYRTLGWMEAIWKSFHTIIEPKIILPKLPVKATESLPPTNYSNHSCTLNYTGSPNDAGVL